MKKGIVFVSMILLAVCSACSLIEPRLTPRMSVTEPVSRAYAVQTKTIMVNDLNIAYQEAGNGPSVILIHGGVVPMSGAASFLANPLADLASIFVGYVPLSQSVLHAGAISVSDTWNHNLKALAEDGFHVIALDLPGFGGSDKPDIAYTLEDFVTYLDGFLAAKGIGKASLVGHGLGGQIALKYALEHPDKVDKLVLVDSFGAYGLAGRWTLLKKSPLNLPRGVVKLWQNEKAAKTRFFLPLYRKTLRGWELPATAAVRFAISPKNRNDSRNTAGALILRREGPAQDYLDSLAEYKSSWITTEQARKEIQAAHLALMETRKKEPGKSLDQIDLPVLVIRGQWDPVVSQDEAEYMEEMLPKARLIVYEDSAHYPMVEEAERFNYDVSFFLSAKTLASSK